MIKIYFNSNELFLAASDDPELEDFSGLKNVVIKKAATSAQIIDAIGKMNGTQDTCHIITHRNLNFLQQTFFDHFFFIEAAGGLVMNSRNEILFIHRRGKWDLPKGKMERGESPESCAAREIEEETGVGQLQLKDKITDTYHVYEEKGKSVLKKTYWFYFTTAFEGTPRPQTEEDITGISWIGKDNLGLPLSDTYGSIMEVIEKGASIF